jgi:argininosuccinate synthase
MVPVCWRARSCNNFPVFDGSRAVLAADESDPLKIYLYLNKIGGEHGVGRVDVVENRYVGIKSRGVYESPGAEILRQAHIGVEGEECLRYSKFSQQLVQCCRLQV